MKKFIIHLLKINKKYDIIVIMNEKGITKMKKIKKVFENILFGCSIILTIWFVGSFFEISAKNKTEYPQYSKLNAFTIVSTIFEKENTNNG